MKAEELLSDLIERTRFNLNEAGKLNQLNFGALNHKPNPEKWSALECLEHLNLYGDFYLPEIEKRIAESPYPAHSEFNSGWLGDYFAKSMLPREKINAMKTFKDKNPAGSRLEKSTVDRFIKQQHKTLDLLNRARRVDLSKTKTSISITSLLKLRLGDTFRVIVYHNQRHLIQAKKSLQVN